MNRRDFLAASAAPTLHNAPRPPQPNVILILTDDLGWWDLGVHGNQAIETPVLDRLASESVRFSQFYATPVCTPTRAGLMTGRYYQRTGAVDTICGRDNLNLDEITLADVFRKRGYRTGLVGKWHLGRHMRYHPNHRGFDEFFGFWQAYLKHYDDPDELFENQQPVTCPGYITNVLTDQAVSFLERHRGTPFFLYLAYNAVHNPHLVPDPFIERYLKKGLPLREARIYGMVSALDQNLGRLLKTVDALGLRDDTLLLFMSDNGGVSRHFSAGLRGGKESTYEGGVRVPFFARWPGRFPAGAVVRAPAINIDVFPTLCQLLGEPLPAGRVIDGKTILPLMEQGGGNSPHDYLYFQYNRVRPLLDIPAALPRLAPDDARLFRPNWAIRDVRGPKLVRGGPEAAALELFDLENDPAEARNLAPQRPALVRQLQGRFESWFRDVISGQDYGQTPIEVGRPDEDPVEIDVSWAEARGAKVQPTWRGYSADAVENWTQPGDAVRWKIEVVRPGRYEVVLNYGCRPGDAGGRLLVQAGGAKVQHTVQATAGRGVFRTLSAGTLSLPAGPTVLEMEAAAVTGGELMLLHKVWLKRSAP